MDAKLKAKWVKALRSGTYLQGTGYLSRLESDKATFCCLGVLFDLHKASWDEWSDGSRGCKLSGEAYSGNAQKNELHRAFPFIPLITIERLMHMNDGSGAITPHRKSFAEIADYIEENL